METAWNLSGNFQYVIPGSPEGHAFTSENLIAVIGFELKGTQAIIKHINVSDDFKKHGIGNCLIQKVIKDHVLSSILLETDDESVGFYKKLGFKCEPFDSEYGNRYRCHLDLS